MTRGLTQSSVLQWKYTGSLVAASWSLYIRKLLPSSLQHETFLFAEKSNYPIHYKGRLLATCYCADFICFDSIVVELKALARLSGTEEAQVINYLKATRYEIGLLLNFGNRSLEHRRLVFSKSV